MKVTFVSLMGTEYEISVDKSDDIRAIKEQVETFLGCSNISFIKNNKEIIGGTIESNNIFDGDKINFIINMKTGRDIVQQKIDTITLQNINNYRHQIINEIYDINKYGDISPIFVNTSDKKENIISFSTPLEHLQHLQQTYSLKEEDYDREDMRILFQRCRNQIEDEYNKEQQIKKENEKTKKKIEELKKRMAQRKNKKNKKTGKPSNFGGLCKGFLL
jgi:hypothetical protein